MIPQPRLLIVEDDEGIREDLAQTFTDPGPVLTKGSALASFQVETAETAPQARQLLSRAGSADTPYEVTLLDLGLPREAGSRARDDPSVGLEVLKELDERACMAVVVASAHANNPVVLHELIRRRVVYEVVSKPWQASNEDIFRRTVDAYESGQAKRWLEVRRQRVKRWLLIQSFAQVADRIGQAVSEALNVVLARVEELTDLIEQEYGWDLGGEGKNPVPKALASMRRAISLVPARYVEACALLDDSSGPLAQISLEEIVAAVCRNLSSGIASKQLALEPPPEGQHRLRTFGREVETALEVMVFSAIEASPKGGALRMKIGRSTDGPASLDIEVADEASRIDAAVVERIMGGDMLRPGLDLGWELALGRRIAHSIGASLDIRATPRGNALTLHLPVIDYDAAIARR